MSWESRYGAGNFHNGKIRRDLWLEGLLEGIDGAKMRYITRVAQDRITRVVLRDSEGYRNSLIRVKGYALMTMTASAIYREPESTLSQLGSLLRQFDPAKGRLQTLEELWSTLEPVRRVVPELERYDIKLRRVNGNFHAPHVA